ncbi:MAG: D-sedoheptulose 7-phosphate isomerase [Mariprofundaceae bacterium]|nr:D-sedoheptulose 7-phosphate isomerase [Mariprofundaceae bacterium]
MSILNKTSSGDSPMHHMIKQVMEDGIVLRQQCQVLLQEPLLQAADLMQACLKQNKKILVCGNGGSAADAQHFVAELVNRFEKNRPALAALALTNDSSVLTSIANDFSFERVFSRQIEALGQSGDVLLAISTSGTSANVLEAVKAAKHQHMTVILLTGGNKSSISPLCDVHIEIPHLSTARVQEMHITCLHLLCTLIDEMLFPC